MTDLIESILKEFPFIKVIKAIERERLFIYTFSIHKDNENCYILKNFEPHNLTIWKYLVGYAQF